MDCLGPVSWTWPEGRAGPEDGERWMEGALWVEREGVWPAEESLTREETVAVRRWHQVEKAWPKK